MNNIIDKIQEGVRVFLRYISWRKILTFSFFAFVATVLWFMQIYNQKFETTIQLPIKYTFVPDSIVFEDSLPAYMNVKLKDDGFAMFKYSFYRKDTIQLNVASIIKNNSGKVLQGPSLDKYIRNALSASSQVINYDPVRITFSYAQLESKKIPVIFDGNISLAPGYLLKNDIILLPDSVIAYGARKDLNNLSYAYTAKDSVSGVESNRVLSVDLLPIPNIRLVPSNIKVDIRAEAYIQKNIEVSVECLNLPDDLIVKLFPSKVNLLFFVGLSSEDTIQAKDFVVAVDYEELKGLTTPSVPVRLISSPEYARSITIKPTNVEFIFEHKIE